MQEDINGSSLRAAARLKPPTCGTFSIENTTTAATVMTRMTKILARSNVIWSMMRQYQCE